MIGQTQTVPGNRAGVRIECAAGCLWVTQAGGNEDIVLSASENRTLRGRGLIVIEALKPARMLVGIAPSTTC